MPVWTGALALTESRPVWGAWIEIPRRLAGCRHRGGRAPYGARGLKSLARWQGVGIVESRPVWGAWIEMGGYRPPRRGPCVAPRMGRVD